MDDQDSVVETVHGMITGRMLRGMSFEDLPKNWSNAPITESNLNDVFDLFISYEDRCRSTITFLLLDDTEHLVQPIAINDVPEAPAEPPWPFLDPLAELLDQLEGWVLFGRGRLGPHRLNPSDLRWQGWIARAFGNRLLGSFLATGNEVSAYEQCAFGYELAG